MSAREYRERLIDEVRKYPVLYDTRHESHRDNDARDRCWAEISHRLAANSEVLKREWKILRDSLRQAVKKKRAGVTTKAGAPCKRWRFQSRMAFVLPYMTRRHQRPSIRVDIKPDAEAEAASEPEGGGGGGGEVWEAGGAGAAALAGLAGLAGDEGCGEGGEGADALELFFASVCQSTRRLSAPAQRRVRRAVLDALLQAEEDAPVPPIAPIPPDADRPHF